jgi:hypothetical protein
VKRNGQEFMLIEGTGAFFRVESVFFLAVVDKATDEVEELSL